jgi:hypothetical protein
MPRRRDKPYNGDVDNPNITTRSSQGSNESTYNSPVNIMSVNGPVLEPLQSKITDITSPATSLLGMLKESGSMKADLNVTTNTQMLQKKYETKYLDEYTKEDDDDYLLERINSMETKFGHLQLNITRELDNVVKIISSLSLQNSRAEVKTKLAEEEEDSTSSYIRNLATPKKYNSRMSIMDSLAKPMPSQIVVPVVNKALPPYDHIRLYRIKVIEVIDFLEKLSRYQAEHNITLKIQTLLTKEVQEEIIVDIDPGMKFQTFLNLPSEDVLRCIEERAKPQSKTSFIIALSKPIELDWPKNYSIQFSNLHIAYKKYNVYKNYFMNRFDLIASNNEVNVPNCSDQKTDDGLIYYFLKGIDNFEYPRKHYNDHKSKFQAIFKDIDQEARNAKKTPSESLKFHKFIDLFYELLAFDYERHKECRSIHEKLTTNKYSNEKFSSAQQYTTTKKHFVKGKYNEKKLNLMYEDDAESVESEEVEKLQKTFRRGYIDEDGYESSGLPLGYVNTVDEEDEFGDMELPVLNQMNENVDKEEVPKVCFRQLFYENCPSGDKCKWGHRPEDLKSGYKHYAALLSKSKLKPNNFFIGYKDKINLVDQTPMKPAAIPDFRNAKNTSKDRSSGLLRHLATEPAEVQDTECDGSKTRT